MFMININAAFIFRFFKGWSFIFMRAEPPSCLFLSHKHFFIKKTIELFLYFVLVVILIVSFSFIERLHSFVD